MKWNAVKKFEEQSLNERKKIIIGSLFRLIRDIERSTDIYENCYFSPGIDYKRVAVGLPKQYKYIDTGERSAKIEINYKLKEIVENETY